MLSYAQTSIVICLSVAGALLLVMVLNRLWPIQNRKLLNDVTGWQLGVLGTTYGVILGFMLYTVWEGFRAAQIDADLEATSMLNVYRVAGGLPSPQKERIRELARRYESVVVKEEWPAMQHQQEDRPTTAVLGEMWQVLETAKPETAIVTNSIDHIQYAMSDLAERRNMREHQRSDQMPSLLWVLLVLGGGATIVSSCLLGNDKKWLHYCQVGALTFVVATALSAIADLARPYEGAVAVQPGSFVLALKAMESQEKH
ncbi:uncharacterized protein DUF4239 [Edaphobacter modestus]|uniref:Uncharacterized protein DUF4239 n=2 Tax=Edaphobacter modestus TaxID=388466 RepID=A0A4Q7Z0G9_9BACT|nr:DUF4239 domain-containing protein [Edaphobacter modestus]RZU43324.1 uncharacterized protein DUF4239 [Edaphobacter modestus]